MIAKQVLHADRQTAQSTRLLEILRQKRHSLILLSQTSFSGPGVMINLDDQLDWVCNRIRDTPLVGSMRVSPGRINQGRRPSPRLVVPSPKVAPTKRSPRGNSGILCLLLLPFMPHASFFSHLTKTSISPEILPAFGTRWGQLRHPTSQTNSTDVRTPGTLLGSVQPHRASAKTFLPLE